MKHKSKTEINEGHYLELMDRLYVQICMTEDHLLNHPLTDEIKKVKKLIDKAGMSLARAYQIVGQESYLYDERKKNEKIVLRRRKKPKN